MKRPIKTTSPLRPLSLSELHRATGGNTVIGYNRMLLSDNTKLGETLASAR